MRTASHASPAAGAINLGSTPVPLHSTIVSLSKPT